MKHFIARARKAVLAAGVSGLVGLSVYVQASPLNFTDWQPWVSGGIAAFLGGVGTYFIPNRKPFDPDNPMDETEPGTGTTDWSGLPGDEPPMEWQPPEYQFPKRPGV